MHPSGQSLIVIGELAALVTAISWAIAPAVFYRNALAKINPISANIVLCVSNGLVLVIFLFAFGLTNTLASLPPWILVVKIVSGANDLGVGETPFNLSTRGRQLAVFTPLKYRDEVT